MDNGKHPVRGKSQIRPLLLGQVVLDAPVSGLLITADDVPHMIPDGKTALLHRLHGIERSNQRSLVIDGPPPVHFPIHDLRHKRIL